MPVNPGLGQVKKKTSFWVFYSKAHLLKQYGEMSICKKKLIWEKKTEEAREDSNHAHSINHFRNINRTKVVTYYMLE